MIRSQCAAVFAALLFGLGFGVAACAPADFHYADGAPGRYADWNGRWVVMNYWAEWCAPCRDEIPELNALYGRSDPDRPVVVGINFDGLTGEELTRLIERMGIAFPVLVGTPRQRWDYPLPSVLPMSVLIRPDGTLATTLVGPQTRATLESAMSAAARQSAAGG